MVQPVQINGTTIAPTTALQEQNNQALKISVIALTALASFVSMIVLPLELALPLTAAIVILGLVIYSEIDSPTILEPRPVYETPYIPIEPWYSFPSIRHYFYNPPSYVHYQPSIHRSILPMHNCPQHAPVGTREITRIHLPNFNSFFEPSSSSRSFGLGGTHAPVGRR